MGSTKSYRDVDVRVITETGQLTQLDVKALHLCVWVLCRKGDGLQQILDVYRQKPALNHKMISEVVNFS
jgi:hypothetical protein